MLPLKNLFSEYPAHLHVFSENILKEYFQYKILEIIFESKYASKLCFLGGTALRIVHKSNRFSENLDFDNFDLSEDEFIDLSKEIQKRLTLEGLEVEIRNIFKGAYHCHIKIPQLLYQENLSPMKEQKILIQIDTVPQNFEYIPEQIMLEKWDVRVPIFSTPKELLLAQKIYASVERKRTKGRDFYDIVFLLQQGIEPNLKYLSKNIGIKSRDEILPFLLEKTEKFNFKKLAKDVEVFLFTPYDIKKVEKFREFIETHWG